MSDSWSIPEEFSPRLRLNRARELANELLVEVDNAIDGAALNLYGEQNPSANELTIFATESLTPPARWGAILQGCFHEARVSLDQLAKQLALVKPDQQLSVKQRRKVSFPLSDCNAQKFATDWTWLGEFLRQEDWERMVQLQLFNASNPDIWGPLSGDGILNFVPVHLAKLSKLDNRDKHDIMERVQFCIGNPRDWPDGSSLSLPVCPIVKGAVLAVLRYENGLPKELPTSDQIDEFLPLTINFADTWEILGDDAHPGFGSPDFDLRHLVNGCMEATMLAHRIFAPVFKNGAAPLELSHATRLVGSQPSSHRPSPMGKTWGDPYA
jgi:hypothetical protein